MAQITITIPDTIAQRVLDSFAGARGYTGFLQDGITPETKAQFAKRTIINFVKNSVKEWEANNAGNSASITASNNVETQVTLT